MKNTPNKKSLNLDPRMVAFFSGMLTYLLIATIYETSVGSPMLLDIQKFLMGLIS